MSEDGGVVTVKGTPATAEQIAEMTSLRAVFDPKTALDRLDTYGKWLFATAAIVGSLGAGLSNAALPKLHGFSLILFGLAVVCLDVCLVFASLSLAPKWVEANYYELLSMRAAVNKQLRKRQVLLTSASIFFCLALLLAAAAPLISLRPSKSEPSIHYSIDEKGALDAVLEASDLEPKSVIRLRLESADAKVQTPSTSAIVDASRQVKLNLKMTGVNSLTSNLTLVACFAPEQMTQTSCPTEIKLPVIQK